MKSIMNATRHQETVVGAMGSPKEICILHLEDSDLDAELILLVLRSEGLNCSITRARRKAEFEEAVTNGSFDVILCDHNLPGYNGFTALAFAKQHQPMVPVITLSGSLDDAQAVESLKRGATDYILKERLARLIPAIRRALDESEERKRKEAAELRIREQANMLNLTRDAIIVRDMEGRVVYWYAGAERLLGWTAEEAIGQEFVPFLGAEEAVMETAEKMLLQSGGWLGELRFKGKAGEEIIVQSSWSVLRGKDGQPQRILTINSDVTEKKKLEIVLHRAQRMDSIGALAGGIAHDLNNALAPVFMCSELLDTCEEAETRHQYVTMILTSATRAKGMVKQILSFTRGRGGRFGPVAISELVREMEKMVRDTFPKTISISVDRGVQNSWTIQGDATELHQILLNLCVNARDAMPSGGKLSLALQNENLNVSLAASLKILPGPYVRLSVADTGTGIPPEVLPRIFEPFFTTKPAEKGTGLGLATVMGIIKHYGGGIDIKTEPGKGTEFSVYLPALPNAEKAGERKELASLPVGRGELILIIEDEDAVCELTKTSLENFGYQVVVARNGVEGLARFGEHSEAVRVVVTDTDMPEMNGLVAVRKIREMKPELPVILASGSKHESEELARLEAEGMTNLGKPYTLEQLLVGVATAINHD